jgi:hypothetical protein
VDKKPLIRKGSVVGVIFLFLGVAVQPTISMNITQIEEVKSIVNANVSHNAEGCNCEDDITQDLVKVDTALDKTEIRIKNILLTFGYIPDIKLKCNEFLKFLNTIDPDGPFCRVLEVVFYGLALFFLMPFDYKAGDLYNKGRYVLAEIFLLTYACLLYTFFIPYGLIARSFGCSWAQYYGPDLFIN